MERVDPQGSAIDKSALTLPPVPENMGALASELSGRFVDDPQFAAVEVTLQRDKVIVYWHGKPSAAVLGMISTKPDVSTEFRETRFKPGLLREAARRLLASNPNVESAHARYDGSGLAVSLDPTVPLANRPSQAALQAATGFPTTVDTQAPVAASTRQYDYSYHLGGARIYHPLGDGRASGCTSGFAVRSQLDPAKQGMMFAAHCGTSELGNDWVVSGANTYLWGKTVAFDWDHDGAIIDSGFSQPYMWIGAYDTTNYTKINGGRNAYKNQELCYSGSYSGLVCGNVVTETGVLYKLDNGKLSNITGFMTQQKSGTPAAGNGDSGGPGYEVTYDTYSGSYKRYAVGIISAIPMNSPAECLGVPGSTAENGRKCSPTVYATSVISITNQLGWSVIEQ
ncbi:hypothetical protein ABC795_05550 [Blastococcus sp. HT6-30]|uniref:hypothetical protein n=1 Tax=Blastococcus sp. HT6-30 TaxID=3144843 RepID=UPI003218FACA